MAIEDRRLDQHANENDRRGERDRPRGLRLAAILLRVAESSLKQKLAVYLYDKRT